MTARRSMRRSRPATQGDGRIIPTRGSPSRDGENVATGRVTCPKCRSRLEIFETPSGGRTVSVLGLGTTIEPKALEHFMGPDEGPDIICPACDLQLDPASPYRGELRQFRK